MTAEFDQSPPLQLELPPGEPRPGSMQLYNLVLPADFARFGNTRVSLRLSLRMVQKTYPVRWAVRAGTADSDGTTLSLTLPKGLG